MSKLVVRIEEALIENFKNVKTGTLNFENKRKNYRSSIVGLYGQNGSGKTALIDAIQLLKLSLSGKVISKKYVDYINVDADDSTLSFQFKLNKEDTEYHVWYQFSLKKVEDNLETEENDLSSSKTNYKIQIVDEVLSFSYITKETKLRKSILIDTRTSEVFVPKSKYNELLENNEEDVMELFLMD